MEGAYQITKIETEDIRWPTSLQSDGSDAMVIILLK